MSAAVDQSCTASARDDLQLPPIRPSPLSECDFDYLSAAEKKWTFSAEDLFKRPFLKVCIWNPAGFKALEALISTKMGDRAASMQLNLPGGTQVYRVEEGLSVSLGTHPHSQRLEELALTAKLEKPNAQVDISLRAAAAASFGVATPSALLRPD